MFKLLLETWDEVLDSKLYVCKTLDVMLGMGEG